MIGKYRGLSENRLVALRGTFVRRLVHPFIALVSLSVRNAFVTNIWNTLWKIGKDWGQAKTESRLSRGPQINPISTIICPISEEIRWKHLCSDRNLLIKVLNLCPIIFLAGVSNKMLLCLLKKVLENCLSFCASFFDEWNIFMGQTNVFVVHPVCLSVEESTLGANSDNRLSWKKFCLCGFFCKKP